MVGRLWQKEMIQLKRKFQNCDLRGLLTIGKSVSWGYIQKGYTKEQGLRIS